MLLLLLLDHLLVPRLGNSWRWGWGIDNHRGRLKIGDLRKITTHDLVNGAKPTMVDPAANLRKLDSKNLSQSELATWWVGMTVG